MTAYGTPFLESEALLAAQSGDLVDARKIVEKMLGPERDELELACARLIDICHEVQRAARLARQANRDAARLDAVAVTITKAIGLDPVRIHWGRRSHPFLIEQISIEDPRLPGHGTAGIATLLRTSEDAANVSGAVPGWSWAGHTEPLRDRTGQPLGCDATPEQVADAVLAETEPRW